MDASAGMQNMAILVMNRHIELSEIYMWVYRVRLLWNLDILQQYDEVFFIDKFVCGDRIRHFFPTTLTTPSLRQGQSCRKEFATTRR